MDKIILKACRFYAYHGVFSEEKAVSYIIDIGEALKQIHGRNIVHRDITPNNVIIDENDRAVLLDFDIARMDHSERILR